MKTHPFAVINLFLTAYGYAMNRTEYFRVLRSSKTIDLWTKGITQS